MATTRRLRVPVFLLGLLLVASTVRAAPFTQLIVFGDSLSDQGNAFAVTGGAFPPAPFLERASNGPVAVEYLAAALGIPLVRSTSPGGTNYAYVGAATGPVTFTGTSITTDNFSSVTYGQPALANTGITNQVVGYLATGPVIDPASTLFFIWGGPNDFFIDASAATAANAVMNLAKAIGLLYANGARQFLVPNMPDLSLTPFGLSRPSAQRADLRALSAGFNAGLASALMGLSASPGISITTFDTFSLLTAISTEPAAFGLANASLPCVTGGLGGVANVCASPDTYLFWDSVHPTSAAHGVLGDRFADAVNARTVPEPATLLLVGTGIMAALHRRRRQTHP